MERDVQIGVAAVNRKLRRIQNALFSVRIGCCAGVLTGMLLIGGCSLPGKGLENAYSFEERFPNITAPDSKEQWASAMAKPLCVVMDESAFQDDSINSEAAAIFDINDRDVLFSKNAFRRMNPASTTKIMTALLALKYGNLSDMVTVTDASVITESGATLCGIKPGDTVTLEQLLYGLMLPSGNDAGNAIAVHISESVEAFAELMNKEARALGASNTHFVNPHGLTDENHYTTAYDLYLIFNECLKYEKFVDIISTMTYTAEYMTAAGTPGTQTWNNGNYYLTGQTAAPDGVAVVGGKTGTTNAAGYCLVLYSRDNANNGYISVVLKSDSRNALYSNMTKLLTKIVD